MTRSRMERVFFPVLGSPFIQKAMNDTHPRSILSEFKATWPLMNFHGRFEQIVAQLLSGVIAMAIVIPLVQLVRTLYHCSSRTHSIPWNIMSSRPCSA